jgi:hypothetical protein
MEVAIPWCDSLSALWRWRHGPSSLSRHTPPPAEPLRDTAKVTGWNMILALAPQSFHDCRQGRHPPEVCTTAGLEQGFGSFRDAQAARSWVNSAAISKTACPSCSSWRIWRLATASGSPALPTPIGTDHGRGVGRSDGPPIQALVLQPASDGPSTPSRTSCSGPAFEVPCGRAAAGFVLGRKPTRGMPAAPVARYRLSRDRDKSVRYQPGWGVTNNAYPNRPDLRGGRERLGEPPGGRFPRGGKPREESEESGRSQRRKRTS